MERRMFIHLSVVAAMGLAALGSAAPQGASPFVGEWQAVDADGGDMRLTIGGPPEGPLNITWTEGYFGYCEGGPGIARGQGWLSPDDPYFLEGELLLECFNSEIEPFVMRPGWQYDPGAETLTTHGGEDETDTVWHRPGQPPPPPSWNVIARPADDAVDAGSFPEGTPEGIVVSLLVLDDDHNTLRYETTATVMPDWDPGRVWVFFDLDMDLTVGNHLWVYDGANARELVVTALEVTEVDLGSYTVSGRAEPGSQVYVELSAGLTTVTADEDGNWVAGFGNSDLGQGWAAYQLDSDEDQTRVGFYVPIPHFSVFPEWEYVEGWDWPEGITVTATLNGEDGCTANGQSGHPAWDPPSLFVSMTFPEGCDVATDEVVTLTDGTTTLMHTVQSLAITEVDALADTVTGMADPNAQVHVWPHGYDEVLVTADEDGAWMAAFSTDLVEGICGRSEIRGDGGNATAVDWCVPNPRLIAFPEAENVFGYGWPVGSAVNLSINATPDYTQTATVGPAPWDPNDVMAFFDFGGSYDLKVGDVVTLSGSGMERTHTVQNLTITAVDAVSETVAGTANDGEVVHVWAHGHDESDMHVTAVDGLWQADFDSVSFNLEAGMCGRAEIQVEPNSTAVDWCVAGTGDLYAVPDENRIWANGWIEGDEVNLTIFDPGGGEVYSESRLVPPPSERPWTEVLFESSFDLEAGQRIVIHQGGYERELLVSSIHVTGFDLGAQTIFGTGDSGAEFIVAIDGVDVGATVDGDSTWGVQHENLTGGVWGSAIQFDADGDSTRDIFAAPNPNFYAVLDENRIYANEWIAGAELGLTILDTDGGTVYSESRIVQPPTDVPWTLEIFEPGPALQPGQRIVLDQGGYVRGLIVSSIRVTVFDLGAQTISGTGDSGAEFFVRIRGTDEWGIVGGDETWSVHHEELAGGVWGEAIQPDGDGDATRDGFQAPPT